MTPRDAAFDDFVAARWVSMVRTVYMLGCPADEAEDVVQDALYDSWRHWTRVASADSPDAYVYRILLRRLSKHRRKSARLRQMDVSSTSFERTRKTTDVEAELDIRSLLQELPIERRAVVVLRHIQDLTEQEVADRLGIPIGTVKSRNNRALRDLRNLLGQALEERTKHAPPIR